jgi:hypothetical protein
MTTTQINVEVIDYSIFEKKENNEISFISFFFNEDISIQFSNDDYNPIMIDFIIDKTDAILLAKSILLNYKD